MTTAPKKQPIPFGKYLLLDRINIGGMAEVWRGKMFGAGGFERLVAIKRILPSIAEDEEFITMFIDEAKISVQLTHANIAQIYELGNIQSSYFIAMEYIPGKDMRAIFERCRKKGEPAPIPLTCYVIGKLCEGLDYAHRKKDGMGRDMVIVHRDVSPQNVLISYEGEVKVIDFGIAKAAGKATKTQAGILKGKFGYMSPEQIRGLPLDRRSDVFAIGVCLYEMLTGERLFVGESDFSVLEKVRKVDILPPTTYNRRIPEPLEKIVLKALAREVENRYQYANELADDLQRFLITSESIFSRKDLMAYMKATFAEEVEREKIRIQEYAEVKPPEGFNLAAEMGYAPAPSVVPGPPVAAAPPASSRPSISVPVLAAMPPPASRPALAAHPPGSSGRGHGALATAAAAAVAEPDTVPPTVPGVKRTPSLTNIPKLTAAAPVSQRVLDDSGGATQIADELHPSGGPPPHEFVDAPEPATVPGQLPAALPRPPPPPGQPRGRTPPVMNGPGRPSNPNIPTLRPGAPPRASGSFKPPPLVEDEPEYNTRLDRPGPVDLEEEEDGGVTDEQPIPGGRSGGKGKLVVALAAVAVVALAAAAFVLLRRPAEGFVVIDVADAEVRAKARVNLNGQDLGPPPAWPLLQRTPAGPTLVMVTADGYMPFKLTIDVKEGAHPTTVNAELTAIIQETDLFVLTEPEAAEILIDGTAVKQPGSGEVYSGKISVNKEHTVQVRMPGYRSETQKVLAETPDSPKRLTFKLERLELELAATTQPSGATVLVGGRPLGTTPTVIKVSPDVKSVTFTKRCYEPADVAVSLPANPGSTPVPVWAELRKQPRCR